MPNATAQPVRIGQSGAGAAAWSPNGTRLAYAEGRSLYLANPDGTAPKRLLTLPSINVSSLGWSPEGRHLRFVLADSRIEHPRLWEVEIDRGNGGPLLPGWSREDTDEERGGEWTRDGGYFVFAASHHGVKGIWAIRRHSALFSRWFARPILLTSDADADTVAPGPRGDKIFAIVDRKSTRLELQSLRHLVCRLLLEKKNKLWRRSDGSEPVGRVGRRHDGPRDG